ncbi:hypothetical protein JXA40_03735 [bacterium]|nr:hypothetical protein [candidate division CSSED10-310 bacterium]
MARLLNKMIDSGIITNYAAFGAVAQMRYTEAVITLDADILIAVPDRSMLDVLSPIYTFCRKLGYLPEGEAIRVGDWPVQFIPAFSPLTEEAMERAEIADLEGIPFRVVRAEYLAVIALSVGRAKDFARILALLETGATETGQISELAEKHGLSKKWIEFKRRFNEI